MISKERIKDLVEEKLKESDNYLVDIKVSPSNQIKVFIDNKESLSIDDCVKMSRHIENSLDREEEDFALEVSSPGLGQAFKVLQQYEKNLGRQVRTVTKEGDRFSGKLAEVNENDFTIEENPKGKKKKNQEINKVTLNYDDVKETKVLLSFK